MSYKDIDDYIYMRFGCSSTSTKLLATAAQLGERCRKSRGQVRQVNKDYAPAFAVVLTSLEIHGAYQANRWIRIVTDHNVYGGTTQRTAIHTREILAVIKWLIDFGYLHQADGKHKLIKDGLTTDQFTPFAYTLTDKWRIDVSDKPMSLACEIIRNPLAAYVELRTKVMSNGKTSKRSVMLPITLSHRQAYPECIRGSEALLMALDDVWRGVSITCHEEQLSTMQVSMTRIFNNGSFEQGGRFYCELQNIKKDRRQHLRFNKEPTVEIDFSRMHPSILYQLEGSYLNFDAYHIEGFTEADVKKAFNTLLNRTAADHGKSAAKGFEKSLKLSPDAAQKLEAELYKKHSLVKHRFNTGYGLKLQNIDSQITFEVMTHFVLNVKRPILFIHDSAIVSVRDTELLKLSLVGAYSNVLSKIIGDDDSHPLPYGLKATTAELNESISEAVLKSMEEIDISNSEWDEIIATEHLVNDILTIS